MSDLTHKLIKENKSLVVSKVDNFFIKAVSVTETIFSKLYKKRNVECVM